MEQFLQEHWVLIYGLFMYLMGRIHPKKTESEERNEKRTER